MNSTLVLCPSPPLPLRLPQHTVHSALRFPPWSTLIFLISCLTLAETHQPGTLCCPKIKPILFLGQFLFHILQLTAIHPNSQINLLT